jgi:hypothetical protein
MGRWSAGRSYDVGRVAGCCANRMRRSDTGDYQELINCLGDQRGDSAGGAGAVGACQWNRGPRFRGCGFAPVGEKGRQTLAPEQGSAATRRHRPIRTRAIWRPRASVTRTDDPCQLSSCASSRAIVSACAAACSGVEWADPVSSAYRVPLSIWK